MDEALLLARGASASAALKALDETKAKAGVVEALSRKLPKVSTTASATLMSDPPDGLVIRQGSLGNSPAAGSEFPIAFPDQDYVILPDTRHTYFKIALTASWPVFTWGKIERGVDIAKAGLAAAGAASKKSTADAAWDMKRAYMGAVFARESLSRLEEMNALLAQALASDQGSFDAGDITLQDLLATKSNLARAVSQRSRAREALSTALAAIAYMADRPSIGAEDLTEPLSSFLGGEGERPEDEDEAALAGRAEASSQDLLDMEAKAAMAQSYLSIQKAGVPFRPDVQLQATLDVSGQHIPLIDGNWTDTWSANLLLTLGAQMSVYDGGEAKAKVEQAKAQAHMAVRGLYELRRSLPIQVRRAVDAAKTARAALEEKESAVALAVEQEKNAKVSRENDMLTAKDERGAVSARLAAELERDLAALELGNALIALEALCPAE